MVTTEEEGLCSEGAMLGRGGIGCLQLVLVLVVRTECKDVDDDEVIRGGAATLLEALEYLRASEVLRGSGLVRTGEVAGCWVEVGDVDRSLDEDRD